MYYIGIDPSWTGNNASAVVIVDSQLKLVDYIYTRSCDDIVAKITQFKNAKIGIDAPCCILNDTGHRCNEKQFLKYFSRFKLGLHAVNKRRYPNFFPELLYKRLNEIGFSFYNDSVFEVYPHATIMVCFNNMQVLRYKSNIPISVRRDNISRLYEYITAVIECESLFPVTIAQVKGKQLKKYEDFLDALVCAYTLYYCEHNGCYKFGTCEEGILLVPKPHIEHT